MIKDTIINLHSQGYLPIPCSKQKVPLFQWRKQPYTFNIIDFNSVETYALLCGHNGLCAVDLDIGCPFEIRKAMLDRLRNETLCVATPSKGMHFYFKLKDVGDNKLIFWKNSGAVGELKCKNVLIIGYGSLAVSDKIAGGIEGNYNIVSACKTIKQVSYDDVLRLLDTAGLKVRKTLEPKKVFSLHGRGERHQALKDFLWIWCRVQKELGMDDPQLVKDAASLYTQMTFDTEKDWKPDELSDLCCWAIENILNDEKPEKHKGLNYHRGANYA